TTQPYECVPETAFSLSFRRKVLRCRDGSLIRRSSGPGLSFSHSSFVYSCSLPYLPQPPCSSTTTLKPFVASCLAMMPPAAPEPMITKSTSVEGVNCVMAFSSSLPRLRVVIAEWRLEIQRIVVVDQLPAHLVVVAAVNRAGEKAGDGMRADQREEGRFLHRGEHLDLLIRAERREPGGTREELLRLRVEILQPLDVGLLLVFLKRRQRAIDEVEDARFAGPGRAVAGDDLRRHRVNLGGLRLGEERELDRLTGTSRPLHVGLRLDDAGVVGGDPRAAQTGHGLNQELPPGSLLRAHNLTLQRRVICEASARLRERIRETTGF